MAKNVVKEIRRATRRKFSAEKKVQVMKFTPMKGIWTVMECPMQTNTTFAQPWSALLKMSLSRVVRPCLFYP